MATIFGLNIKLRNEHWPRAESFYHNDNVIMTIMMMMMKITIVMIMMKIMLIMIVMIIMIIMIAPCLTTLA